MSTEEFPSYLDVDHTAGEGESPETYPNIEDKIAEAIDVTRNGLEQYRNPVVMWTGGKDSTLTMYFVREVAREFDLAVPPVVFIDHYQHFDEIHGFVDRWAEEWDLEVIYARNEDVGRYVEEHGLVPGDDIPVAELNEHNRHHVRDILEYEEETFPFLLDTYVGNHLLKTVALNEALEEHDVDGVISGVRWDEQEARADETFFSARHDPDLYPPHDRVQPILQFDERSVWDAFWHYVVPETVEGYPEDGYVPESAEDLPEGVTQADVPVSPKYFAGYRSLGSEISTEKSDEEPAWLQDIESTTERAGRAQDKEDLMERLRDLGYM
jgi:phosphoadenosine phosphosulfate reductase